MAIVHDWLTGMRGGEKVLEVLCELFPEADLYTLFHFPGSVSASIERMGPRVSFLQKVIRRPGLYRNFLPLFPAAIESFKLRGYDLVLSSSHCVAKGVRRPPGAWHVCYCHTPMRYIWDRRGDYLRRLPAWKRAALGAVAAYLRRWDVASTRRVDSFITVSRFVAARIDRIYGRSSLIVHPPVDTRLFTPGGRKGDYYLMVGALAPYKRVDLAIEAFNRLGRPLRIIGRGPEEAYLRRLAGPRVTFLGWQDDEALAQHYREARALVFPQVEDFGIVPLEAQAAGTPVIALGEGGALETVIAANGSAPQATGVFFHEQTPEALQRAVERFERLSWDGAALRRNALRFDREVFKVALRRRVDELLSGPGPGVRRS